jgi:hypothetical protein
MTAVARPSRKTSLSLVLLAWLVVAIPLGWGLYQSVVKSRPLFTAPALPSSSTQPDR